MHPDPDIEASAIGLWFDVFNEHVKRPVGDGVTAEEHVGASAAVADAAERKCRERFARKPALT